MKKIDINISENIDFNTNKSNNINVNKNNKYIYKCIFFSPINKLECVNSMDIYDDLLIYGTIMGNVQLCHIDKEYLYPKENPKKDDIYIINEKILNKNQKFTNKFEIDKKGYEIHPISLTKKIKETLHLDDEEEKSHNNLTYSNINNGIEDEKTEKFSNKGNVINQDKISINNNINNINKINNGNELLIFKNEKKEEENILKINQNLINFNDGGDTPIPFPQITNLISNASENIPCVIFDTKDKVIISVGDEELIKMEGIATLNINDPNSKFDYIRAQNYRSKSFHFINCENTLCFLTPTNYLLVNMNIGDINTSQLRQEEINYKNKNIKDFKKIETIEGKIDSHNFTTIFDFDGSRLLFIEYVKENERKIVIFDTIIEDLIFEYKIGDINGDFGHVSFMRLLPENKIFLVRKNKICEIYQINDDEFIFVETWEHIGEEVLTVQIYFEGSKISKEFVENDININADKESNNISYNFVEKEDKKIIGLKINNINAYNNSSLREFKKRNKQEISNENWDLNDIDIIHDYTNKKFNEDNCEVNIYNKTSNKIGFNKKDKNIFSIVTLDYNGNFNLYQNKKNTVLFNLYNIEGIDQKYKDEEFFYLRFPYYIAMNSKYICISTDQGIFAIKKLKK